MFEIDEWDGLAKIGRYTVNSKEIVTPALFPVVDPKQQSTPIRKLLAKFGFDQVITSAYLMSKRLGHFNWEDYPSISNYLDYDGLIMMDSGAYQVMLYGDIELGIVDTLQLQSHVKPDIGVIMDHPIGYNVGYQEAKQRVDATLQNVNTSISHLDPAINWALPIQGGKYLDLLETYLIEVTKPEILSHFQFFALGSVVPVMINQDYVTMVNMIALARKYLPVDRPLHLFGAGHPAMFALATFLGCDTFDSAAYILMAKDNRYMTVEGTYQLEDLVELPCHCVVCMGHNPSTLLKLEQEARTPLIAEHNLYVSRSEIKLIRQHIHDGNLWDLVLKRANSAPNLAAATQVAIKLVTSGILKSKYRQGIEVSQKSMLRITRIEDLSKPLLNRFRTGGLEYLETHPATEIICVALPMYRSIYNRIPEYQVVEQYDSSRRVPAFLLPPIGLVPYGASDMYPLGQMINEIPIDSLPLGPLLVQFETLLKHGKHITLYYDHDDFASTVETITARFPSINTIRSETLIHDLNDALQSPNSQDSK